MNILIFSHEYPPDVGGLGSVAQQFRSVLIKNDFNVDLITRKNKRRIVSEINKIYEVFVIKGYWLISYYIRFIFFNFSKYDRIILNDFPAVLISSLLFSRRNLSCSIVMWHGSEDKNIFKSSNWRVKLFKKQYIKVLNSCHKIIAVSHFQKDKMIKNCNLEYLRSKVEVQYAGVDDNLFKILKPNNPTIERNKLGLKVSDIILLSVGRINQLKGYTEMYNIFKKLDGNYHWIVVGNGVLKDEIVKWAKRDGILDNVHVIGNIDRSELVNYYNLADLFILFSKPELQEAFGLVYVEAALSGLPVLARKKEFDGTNEAINGIGWLLSTEGEALEFIKTNCFLKVDRCEISKNASGFSIKKLEEGIIKILCY